MKKPKMVLFDYGQTLANERQFDGVKGTRAVMEYAVSNPHGRTAEEIQAVADQLNRELGRFDRTARHKEQIEVPNQMFTAYLYESMGIELSLTHDRLDRVFWDAAAPAVPTRGIETFLDWLAEQGIRTGVISNISYCPQAVRERIEELLPHNRFEFIMATSAYMFRKPNRRIFELALEKAGLEPGEVWYVGDSYECDVQGARNAGLFPVWYTGASEAPEPSDDGVLRINEWSELEEYISACEQ